MPNAEKGEEEASGGSRSFVAAQELGISRGDYVLFVATVEPRKNHL